MASGMRPETDEKDLLATSLRSAHICTVITSLAYVVCTLCGDIPLLYEEQKWFSGIPCPMAWQVRKLITLLHVVFACIIWIPGPAFVLWYAMKAFSRDDVKRFRILVRIDRAGAILAVIFLLWVICDICTAVILLLWNEAAQCMDEGRRDIGGHMRAPAGYSKESCESHKVSLFYTVQSALIILSCTAAICVINNGLWIFAMKLSRRTKRHARQAQSDRGTPEALAHSVPGRAAPAVTLPPTLLGKPLEMQKKWGQPHGLGAGALSPVGESSRDRGTRVTAGMM
jgi:hypothetical protein